MKFNTKSLKQTLILFFSGVLLLGAQQMNAQNGTDTFGAMSYNKAVNVAGKQRMLGQKLAKSYLYLLNNPADAKAKRDMMVSKLVFEKQNNILMTNANSELTKTRLIAVNTLWSDYVKLFDGIPKKANAKKIILMNTDLLKASNDVVLAIIQEAAIAQGGGDELDSDGLSEDSNSLKNIINTSGKQRMLSQRLALYYFATNKNLKEKSSEITLKQVFLELDSALGTLLISEFNTARIDEKLAVAMTKWENLKTSVDKLYSHEIPEAEMYKMSNALTKAFNDVTALYEKVKI
ncbi:type IV pili methyl-accepting chemotaxis transducer N-terminal domain-containing protein [Aureisphaera galaxeae]|uniref:type IV pili methyl-accepting chemotaxis transducer N-terminal domain-containing protein n=1 Tax=Aureisphaera galaxeae TaxID=1538023 RepID=UPI00234FC16F|nr:type IV pili methyl-accepting chemotaxis transducer N-terminal domain-containing protein [Aureisphaera galaxeae]MDC8006260.1 type IV pili methyl-accepting chemotaxis transducer N-terminal domain-containing protein [Aureisphaera galaxeae]